MRSHGNGGVEKIQKITARKNLQCRTEGPRRDTIGAHVTDSLRLRERGQRAFKNSDDLLQAYISDKFRSRRRELYINIAVRRLVNRARFPVSERVSRKKETLEIITNLAKHEAIFRRILDYANQRTKHNFFKVTYSTMNSMHTALMGVVVKPPVPFDILAGLLEGSTLPEAFAYPLRADVDLSDFIDVFPEETEVSEMSSTAETNARFRISTILKKIILRMRRKEIIAVGEEISLGYCGDQVGPIEIRHAKGDGTISSVFISGRLDYVCFKAPSCIAKKVLELKSKKANVNDALRSFWVHMSFVGIRFDDFLNNLERNLDENHVLYDPLEDDLPWEVFALEAKHMKERFSYKAGAASGPELDDPAALPQDNNPHQTPDNSDISNDDRGNHQPYAPDGVDIASAYVSRSVTYIARTQIMDWNNLSPLQILVHNPIHWMVAYRQLWTLAPEIFVDASILDRYLLEISSSQLDIFHMRYIPFHFLRSTNPSDREIANFRELAGLSRHTGSCPFENALGVIHQFDHFYVVVVLPNSQEIHVLGKGIQTEKQYQDQTGWNYWRLHLSGVALYYGWDMSHYRILRTDWPQNGFDCGPIACQVAAFILQHGFDLNKKGFWAMPTLPCAHGMRRNLTLKVSDETMESLAQSSSLLDCGDPALLQSLYGSDLEGMRSQIRGFKNIVYRDNGCLEVLAKLDQKMLTCQSCRVSRNRNASSNDPAPEAPSSTDSLSQPESTDGRVVSEDSLDDIEVINMLLRECSFDSDANGESDKLRPRPLSSESVLDGSQVTTESTEHGYSQNGASQLAEATLHASRNDQEREVTDNVHDAASGDNELEGATRRRDVASNNPGKKNSELPYLGQKAPAPSTRSRTSRSQRKPRKALTHGSSNLTKHLPQVIGQCLAINAGIEAGSRKPEVIKFGISSSNDWLFGLLDCSGGTRLCYTTDTLTVRTEEDLKNMIFLLLTWMVVPGREVLQHFPRKDA